MRARSRHTRAGRRTTGHRRNKKSTLARVTARSGVRRCLSRARTAPRTSPPPCSPRRTLRASRESSVERIASAALSRLSRYVLHDEPATSRQLRPLVVDAAFRVQSARLARCRELQHPESEYSLLGELRRCRPPARDDRQRPAVAVEKALDVGAAGRAARHRLRPGDRSRRHSGEREAGALASMYAAGTMSIASTCDRAAAW